MPPSTFSLLVAATAFSTFIYSYFTGKSETEDVHSPCPSPCPSSSSRPSNPAQRQQQPEPSPSSFNSRGQTTPTPSVSDLQRSYYYSTSHAVNSRSTPPSPSTSTYTQPSYQQPRVKSLTPQATAKTKENLESSLHAHHHGFASSSRTVPTSAAQAQIPHPKSPSQSPSHVRQTTSTTSDHLDPFHPTSLTPSDAWNSRLTPTPSTYSLVDTSYTAQQTSALGTQHTARTPARASYRTDFASPSVYDSYQTTPTRTHTSYLTQQTSRTPARTDYDNSLYRSDFASPSVSESHQTPSTPTRTNALYSTQQASRVVRSTIQTSTMYDDDDDDMGPSPYSYLQTPSADASRTRVSRLTVSPQKHSRTHSSSSDSDYLGSSSRTRAVPPSRDYEVSEAHGAITDAQQRKKAKQLRDQAKRNARDMLDARDRAKIAQRMGDYEAEEEYGQEARAHESEKKNSDKHAAKIFFSVNNKAHVEGTVDLHNLYVAEAEEYAKKELESAMYRNDDTVTFIVGQGKHSEDGVSKLRPALEELFDERRLRYSLDPGNAGKLIVYLH